MQSKNFTDGTLWEYENAKKTKLKRAQGTADTTFMTTEFADKVDNQIESDCYIEEQVANRKKDIFFYR
jgi:hypothetical protein